MLNIMREKETEKTERNYNHNRNGMCYGID